jgi:hypothetical protein
MAEREGFRHSPIATLGLRARIPSHSTFSLCARLWRSETSSRTRPSLRSGFGHESLPTAHSLSALACGRARRLQALRGSRRFEFESLSLRHSTRLASPFGSRRLRSGESKKPRRTPAPARSRREPTPEPSRTPGATTDRAWQIAERRADFRHLRYRHPGLLVRSSPAPAWAPAGSRPRGPA